MDQREEEWTWPYFQENYTGPYLSDGRLQASVAHGKTKPRSKLDRLSRDHDTAYALSRNEKDRRKADRLYYEDTRDMGWFPRLAGDIVLYANDPALIFGVDRHPDLPIRGGGRNKMGGNNSKPTKSKQRDAFEKMLRADKQKNDYEKTYESGKTTAAPNQPPKTWAPGQPMMAPTAVYQPTPSDQKDPPSEGSTYPGIRMTGSRRPRRMQKGRR